MAQQDIQVSVPIVGIDPSKPVAYAAQVYDEATEQPMSEVASKVDGLATVATSGSYNDLTDKPTIPAPVDVSGKANKSEMSVTPGTGANADKTTIQLKSGTSATVLTQHQDISGKANISDVYTKVEGQALESEVDSRLDGQDAAIALLNGNDVVVVADHTAVANPDSQKIYRQYGTNSYTDWMYQNSAWQAIATYSYPGVDEVPTKNSEKLVKSGGVAGYVSVSQNASTGKTTIQVGNSNPIDVANGDISDYAKIQAGETTDNDEIDILTNEDAMVASFDNEGVNAKGYSLISADNNKYNIIERGQGSLASEEKISIEDNEGNEVASFDKDGFNAKRVSVDGNEVIPIGAEGRRTLDTDAIVITSDNGGFIAKIDNDNIKVKDIYIADSPEDEGESFKEYVRGVGNVSINLPDTITAVVGDTLQIFFRGVLECFNPYIYDLKVTCSKGWQTPRYFQVTPTADDVGEYAMTFTIRNAKGEPMISKNTVLRIVNKTALDTSVKNILCFGDSLTSGGDWCAEANRRLTGNEGTPQGLNLSNIHFMGSKTNGTTGYCGMSGWKWSDFVTEGRAAFRFYVTGVTNVVYGAVYTNNGHSYTVLENQTTGGTGSILCEAGSSSDLPQSSGVLTKQSGEGDSSITFTTIEYDPLNPLWDYSNGKMTFIPYAHSYCNDKIDIVYTLLTWNGQSGWKTNFDDCVRDGAKIFADTLHAEFPNAKLKIIGIQLPSLNGGCGANYGATGNYGDFYGLAVTVMRLNDAYQAFANSTETSGTSGDPYNSFVEFVNLSSQFDSEYNMPFNEVGVNTRNSNQTEMIGTNGVHPTSAGQMQIADVVFRNIVKELNIV